MGPPPPRAHIVGLDPSLAAALGDEGIELTELDVDALGPETPGPVLLLGPEVALTHLSRLDPGPQRPAVVVLVAAPDRLEGALDAGADHAVPASLGPRVLAKLLRRAAERPRLAQEARRAKDAADLLLGHPVLEGIVGAHPAMIELLRRVALVAPRRVTVLIHGETGTGKELIAGALHALSRRVDRPLVKVNCAALSESVLESELFGHERGAFTGAVGRRIGRFEEADGGTLFLDEVSEIPLALQVKLLRFLQERELERVGSNRTIRVDVRVVAATNRDLEQLVNDGRFREDLYYRLNVVRLEVPPLRARRSDVLLLADRFLRELALEHEVPLEGFTEAARVALVAHPWPGNVRGLRNVIEQAVLFAEGPRLDATDLPLGEPKASASPLLLVPGVRLEELERWAILQTLEGTGSVERAAEMLGVSRRTIQYRLRQWGLSARELKTPR